ncbi:hypothetical protein H4Q26_004046 [Puccinia striiformis f. sp. tritici PST-130]|uniref:Uncharacterized protein n=3 Tax=Puccinia striiformis TaxID=27350 RepID=A0A0L0VYS3_9BASI|nr:hypothetical protein H4Q26_004046 [Puccinia striiformis f. sp. tritici PST-130]KNF04413.1 hypothetical protein PSTG_02329 [Puccinia striiformis f. sp. tritici PST-78]
MGCKCDDGPLSPPDRWTSEKNDLPSEAIDVGILTVEYLLNKLLDLGLEPQYTFQKTKQNASFRTDKHQIHATSHMPQVALHAAHSLSCERQVTLTLSPRSHQQLGEMRWFLITFYSALCWPSPALLALPPALRREDNSAVFSPLPDLNGPPDDEPLPLHPSQGLTSLAHSATTSSLQNKPVDPPPVSASHGSSGDRKRKTDCAFPTSAHKRTKMPTSEMIHGADKRKKDDLLASAARKKPRLESVKPAIRPNALVRLAHTDRTKNSRKTAPTYEGLQTHGSRNMEVTPPIRNSDSSTNRKFYPETSERFDVCDWKFLILAAPQSLVTFREPPINRYAQRLFKTLERCGSSPQREGERGYFWIKRAQAVPQLHKYMQIKPECAFPSESDYQKDADVRSVALSHVVLSLSDSKLSLDTYEIYSVGIVDRLETIVEANREKIYVLRSKISPTKRIRRISEKRISTIMKYVDNTTKIATFLVVIHLSLFREHKQDVLTTQTIREILTCFQRMWTDTASAQEGLLCKFAWAKRNWALLSLDNPEKITTEFIYQPQNVYRMAWNFVDYWADTNRKSVRAGYGLERSYHNSEVFIGLHEHNL